jgi:hypothetical protein
MALKNKKPLKQKNKKLKVNINNKNKNKIVININSNNKKKTVKHSPKPNDKFISQPYYTPPPPTVINMTPPSSIFDNGNYLKTQLMHDNRINNIANTIQTNTELLNDIMGRVNDRVRNDGLVYPAKRYDEIAKQAEKSLYQGSSLISEDDEDSTLGIPAISTSVIKQKKDDVYDMGFGFSHQVGDYNDDMRNYEFDEDAPYGRNKDGSIRQKPGRKPKQRSGSF